MLYGAIITSGEPQVITEDDGGEVLHLSSAVLMNPKDSSRTYLMVNSGGNSICAAVLQKDKTEMANIDLFVGVDHGTTLSIKGGKNEVHITGYFEPSIDDMPEDDSESGEEVNAEGASDLSAEEDEEVPAGRLVTPKSASKKRGAKVEEIKEDEESDEDDNEDKDSDSDDEPQMIDNQAADDDNLDEDDDDDDTNDDEASPQVETRPSPTPQKRTAPHGKKEPLKKKLKGDIKPAKGAQAGVEKFQTEIVQYLKTHGKVNLAMLGSKIQKPADVTQKLGTFVKERPRVFKVDKDTVSLA